MYVVFERMFKATNLYITNQKIKVMSDVQIDESRKKVLHAEFEQSYFSTIKEKLIEEKKQYTVFPPANLIFNAFNTTPFDNVKVVLLGQDPYHGQGQAMGLSFSVPK